MHAASLAVLLLASAADPARGAARLEPCRLPRLDEPARCGRLEVFEDRAARRGRRISIRVAVLPATGQRRAPDPLFVLQGGPGQAASNLADFYADAFAPPGRGR